MVVPDEVTKKAFEKAAKDIWSFSKITAFEIGDEKSFKEEDETKLYLKIKEEQSQGMPQGTRVSTSNSSGGTTTSLTKTTTYTKGLYQDISTGYLMAISYGRSKKAFVKTYVPIDGESEELTEEVIYFGLAALQTQISYVYDSKVKNSLKYGGYLKEQGPSLKNKTLVVLENVLTPSKKETNEDILSEYSGKIKALSYEEWRSVIVNKEAGMAYVMPVPFPIGGNYMFQYWVVDAETGKVLGVQQKSVGTGKKLSAELNSKIMGEINDILLGK